MGLAARIRAFFRERRRAERIPLPVFARLEGFGGAREVELVNLSMTGALLYLHNSIRLNSRVTLILDARRISATVVRVTGHRCGIRFDTPLSAHDVQEIQAGDTRRA